MKLNLNVSLEVTPEQLVLAITYDGKTVGQLSLPALIGNPGTNTISERRGAVAGVFLAAMDKAVELRGAEKEASP